MAMKLNAGEVGRSDEFTIDPQFIVVEDSLNGRWTPHDQDAIDKMAKSFETDGQLQAVQVRRIADNKVQLVLGYRRFNAAKLYNERHPDSPMKLKCKVVIVNDEEAFRRNIIENRERAETTPIDDAHNQNRLRDGFSWTDTKIAEFYNVTPPYVGTLKKLLTLPNDVQILVHTRKLSVQAAADLADLPQDQQKQVLQASQTEGLTSGTVTKHTRNKKIDAGKKGSSRSVKEIRSLLESLTGPAEPPNVKKFAEEFLKFIQGKIKDDTLEKRIREILASPQPPGPQTALVPPLPDQEPPCPVSVDSSPSEPPCPISNPVVGPMTVDQVA